MKEIEVENTIEIVGGDDSSWGVMLGLAFAAGVAGSGGLLLVAAGTGAALAYFDLI